jgi:predicted amidohydrolase YtcJ
MPANLLVHNAQIYSMEAEGELYSAMLIKDGKIEKLYESDPNPASLQVKSLDLAGKAVLPGLIDGHFHFMPTAGLHEMALNVSEIENGKLIPDNLDDFRIKLQQYIQSRPATFPILCFNYIIPSMKEDRLPFKEELDSYAPNRAIIIISMDGHSSAYSTLGLKLMGISPEGHSGILEGAAHEFQMGRLNEVVLKFLSLPTLIAGIQHTVNDAIQHGLVGLNCLEGFEDSQKDMVMWAFSKFAPMVPLYCRLFPQYLNLDRIQPLVKKMSYSRLGGCGSWEQDGSIGSRTAAFYESYLDNQENFGKVYYTNEKLTQCIQNAHNNGFQITSHAIGTKAIDNVLTAFDIVLKKENYQNKYRHRIDHFEFPTYEQVDWAISKLGLLITAQPGYSWMDETFQKGYRKYLRPEQFQRQIPLKRIMNLGGILIGGSDSPVQHLNPFTQIHGMVNFPLEHERLTVYDAFRTYTFNAAYSTFEENSRGTLKVGKFADFIVFKDDPFEIAPEKIIELKVEKTFIQGKQMDQVKDSPIKFLFKALGQKRRKI